MRFLFSRTLTFFGHFVVKWLTSTTPERLHASSLSCRLTAMSLKLYFRLFEPKTSSEATIQAKHASQELRNRDCPLSPAQRPLKQTFKIVGGQWKSPKKIF